MRGDHCQNSTLYKIIYSDHLMTELQVRQQTVRIYKQPIVTCLNELNLPYIYHVQLYKLRNLFTE